MITTRWQWLLQQFSRRLFFRAGVIAALSVAAAFAAILLKPFIPEKLALQVGADAVDSILTIIASSMLAVTTFSLSTVVSAYASAASTATPRAIGLMQQDTAAQNMLATFVGAFVYSLVGIVLLKTGIYGDSGRLVLFAVTIAVIALLIVTLLRWIDFLLRFGRLGEVISRVEDAAVAALEARRANPWLGGKPLAEDWKPRTGMNVVNAQKVGYVQHVDMAQLQEAAGEEREIFLAALPGALVHPGRPLAWYDGAGDEDVSRRVATAFSFGSERSYEQDPRLGVIALSEIASRALSPAVNDPGTAIQIIARGVRVLSVWAGSEADGKDIEFDRVAVPGIPVDELFNDFFLPIGRDAAGVAEVQVRLQKALAALAETGRETGDDRYVDAALRHSRIALERADKALSVGEDIGHVRRAADQTALTCGAG